MIPIIKLRIFNNDYVGNGAHTVPMKNKQFHLFTGENVNKKISQNVL